MIYGDNGGETEELYSIGTADVEQQNQTLWGLKLYSISASGLHKSQIAVSFLQGALILPGTAQYSHVVCWRVHLHTQEAQAEGSAAEIRAAHSPLLCTAACNNI